MISIQAIRDNFSRAARSYDRYADIQAELAGELMEKALAQDHSYKAILDIGCATGGLLKDLEKCFPGSSVLGLDISLEMVKIANSKKLTLLVGDGAHLPFAKESFDLILSNSVYQWVSDLSQAFKEAYAILRNNGCLIFSCFGSQTLKELRNSFGIRENSLPTKEALADSLRQAGFSGIELSVSLRNKYFDNLTDILRWLRYIGANRINSGDSKLLTPSRLAQAGHFYYSNYRNNGKIYASFEVISVKANKSGIE